jgi:hypothetical protein
VLIAIAAVVVGAGAGWAARGHRRVLLAIAIAAPILAVAAFAAQFVPGGATECTSSTIVATSGGTTGGTGAADTCRAVAAVSGWSELAFFIAASLCLLSLAPLVALRRGRWTGVAVSAGLQLIPQIVSFGGFLDWAPALLATTAVAFALAIQPRVPANA